MKVLPLQLRTVTRTQGNNAALKDGTVTPQGFAFEFEEVDPLIRAFRRMVRELEYDVCELAITTYLCAKEHGKPFTALPVFLVRGFHHGAILANTKLVRGPMDLEGQRVGVNRGYTVTTGVWARGILAEEYGVDLDPEQRAVVRDLRHRELAQLGPTRAGPHGCHHQLCHPPPSLT